jgi:hypothetical protein
MFRGFGSRTETLPYDPTLLKILEEEKKKKKRRKKGKTERGLN